MNLIKPNKWCTLKFTFLSHFFLSVNSIIIFVSWKFAIHQSENRGRLCHSLPNCSGRKFLYNRLYCYIRYFSNWNMLAIHRICWRSGKWFSTDQYRWKIEKISCPSENTVLWHRSKLYQCEAVEYAFANHFNECTLLWIDDFIFSDLPVISIKFMNSKHFAFSYGRYWPYAVAP